MTDRDAAVRAEFFRRIDQSIDGEQQGTRIKHMYDWSVAAVPPSATGDGGLRALFAPYFEAHENADDDEDNEWCLKHLPRVAEVRAALAAQPAEGLALYFVFDGPPGPVSGHFVEVETADGQSVRCGGAWHEHPTAPGLWRLGPVVALAQPAEGLDALERAQRFVISTADEADAKDWGPAGEPPKCATCGHYGPEHHPRADPRNGPNPCHRASTGWSPDCPCRDFALRSESPDSEPERECLCEGEFVWACGPECECYHHDECDLSTGTHRGTCALCVGSESPDSEPKP